jgi:hypothetical protein
MATSVSQVNCDRCGYEFGDYEVNCHTGESEFGCRQCGHCESLQWIENDKGSRIGWRHETFDGYGAVWSTLPGNGLSLFYGLRSANEVDEAAQSMRDSIAKGEIDGERSYVTRWDTGAKCVEVVAGKWSEPGT